MSRRHRREVSLKNLLIAKITVNHATFPSTLGEPRRSCCPSRSGEIKSMVEDPFDVLGIAPRFDVNAAEIRRAYLAAIARAHPDRDNDGYNSAPDDDSGPAAAELNEAKRTLEDPHARAVALLARLERSAKPRGASPDGDRSISPTFLAEIMEVREALEAATEETETLRWRGWAQARKAEYARQVGEAFSRLTPAQEPMIDAERAAMLAGIRRILNEWRYIERLLDPERP